MKNIKRIKIGLFGIGNDAYWPQFKGLLNNLKGYLQHVENKLLNYNVEVINLGMIDTPEKAFAAGHRFRQEDVELIFLHITTYALSFTVLPVVQKAKVPVIILNLSPKAAIDYDSFNKMDDRTKMTGKWLEFCAPCPLPEIANAFNRTGVQFFQITGVLENDPHVDKEIGQWIDAARVAHIMFHNRMGVMGHYYSGMLDIYSDMTQQIAYFGGHFEIIEVDELTSLRRQVTQIDIKDRVGLFKNLFEIHPDCSIEELQRAAKTSVALDHLVENHKLGSMAYYYMGTGIPENEDTISSIILGTSLLTARGVPVAGEYEIKNAQAMKIMDTFDAGGSFTEFYACDFNDDIVMMGHDGPGHIEIAEGKTKVKPLMVYHGKVGKGLSVEMSVKHGPITLLSVVQTVDGKIKLLTAEGESISGPILGIGNTNSRYKFPIGARSFVESWSKEGPAHHCAVGVGHISEKIIKLGKLLGMAVTQIC